MGTIVSYRKTLTINWSTLIILLQIVVLYVYLFWDPQNYMAYNSQQQDAKKCELDVN